MHSLDIDVVNMSWTANLSKNVRQKEEYKAIVARFGGLVGAFPTTTFVVAAGNCERDAREFFPASLSHLDNVITVGGASLGYDGRWTGLEGQLKCEGVDGESSSYGESITIAARAQSIWSIQKSTTGGWEYATSTGTSFAAPMVTGTVALLRSIDPGLSPKRIKDILRETADVKTICESTHKNICDCEEEKRAEWKFLRADEAVGSLLSNRSVPTTPTALPIESLFELHGCPGFEKYNVMLFVETSGAMKGPKLEKIKEAIHSFVDYMSKGSKQISRVGLSSFHGPTYNELIPITPMGTGGTTVAIWKEEVNNLNASRDNNDSRYETITQAVRDLENLEPMGDNLLVAFMDNDVWRGGKDPYPQPLLDAIDSVRTSEVAFVLVTVQDPGNHYIIETPFETFMDQNSATTPRVFYTFDTRSDVSEIYQLLSGVGIQVSPP